MDHNRIQVLRDAIHVERLLAGKALEEAAGFYAGGEMDKANEVIKKVGPAVNRLRGLLFAAKVLLSEEEFIFLRAMCSISDQEYADTAAKIEAEVAEFRSILPVLREVGGRGGLSV